MLNETVLEGTVLTYQCDNGLPLTGPNTITCTNAGVWSTEPEAIMCVLPTEGESNEPEAHSNHGVMVIPCGLFVCVILSLLTCVNYFKIKFFPNNYIVTCNNNF